MKIFIFIILFFSSQSLSSDLELECFGEPDLPNMYYGKEILGETWHFGFESKALGFYFSLNESKKTGSVRFIGFMNNQTVQQNKSFPFGFRTLRISLFALITSGMVHIV